MLIPKTMASQRSAPWLETMVVKGMSVTSARTCKPEACMCVVVSVRVCVCALSCKWTAGACCRLLAICCNLACYNVMGSQTLVQKMCVCLCDDVLAMPGATVTAMVAPGSETSIALSPLTGSVASVASSLLQQARTPASHRRRYK